MLGIPTIADRVAQMVVRNRLEPLVEKEFVEDSYGYRPGKSAHQAIEVTKRRCWEYWYCLEFDIVGLFDNIPHDLLKKAVEAHTQDRMVLLYIERWITSPLSVKDELRERSKGIPQGGVISPVLSNLFLHYAFDLWMQRTFPKFPFCRFADDGLVHCRSLQHAEWIKRKLATRMRDCGLELHKDKTKVVFCRPSARDRSSSCQRSFDFLGFRFQVRSAMNRKTQKRFSSFLPAMSPKALKRIRDYIRKNWKIRTLSNLSIEDLARRLNSQIRGWLNYYSFTYPSMVAKLARFVNDQLIRWAKAKYTNLRTGKGRALKWLKRVYKTNPNLFAHWKSYSVN